jgi:hypothetical protein
MNKDNPEASSIDKYCKKYAQGIINDEYKPAFALFHAEYIQNTFKWYIWYELERIGVVFSKENP